MEDKKEIYKKAIEKYTEGGQMLVALEELSELSNEIYKSFRGRTTREKIAEEIADVLITLEQVRMIFHISEEMLDEMTARKLERLERRLRAEE